MITRAEQFENIIRFIFRYGERGLLDWCNANPQMISEDLALTLEEYGDWAAKQKDIKSAKHFFYQSSIIWRMLGQPDKEIEKKIRYLDCDFQLTNNSYYYKILAKNARELLTKARESKYLDSAFCLATLEAECWWFAGLDSKIKEIDTWLKVINRMPRLAEVKELKSRGWFERFISLSATIADRYNTSKIDEAKVANFTSKMKALVEKIKVHTYDGFQFNILPADTHKIVFSLARLLAHFGNDDFANYFLSQEAHRSQSLSDTEGAFESLGLRYALAINSVNLSSKRKEDVKEDLFASLEILRRSYRSRAGRIYNAGMMEFSLGESLRELIQKENNIEEVFFLSESMKSQTLLERVKGYYMIPPPGIAARIYQLEQQLLYSKTNLIPDVTLLSKNELALWDSDSEVNIQALEQLYAESNTGYTDIKQNLSIADLQQSLQDGELIIDLIVPFESMYPARSVSLLAIDNQRAMMITPEKYLNEINKKYKGPIGFVGIEGENRLDLSPLIELILSTRTAIKTKSEQNVNVYLTQLGKLLLQPLESAGFVPENYHCWHFIPSRAFHSVPFAALKDAKGRFLIERVAVTVSPSAAIWAHMSIKQTYKPTRAIAFGNPKITKSDLPSLKNAKKEVERIKNIFSTVEWDVKTDVDATEEYFRKNAPGQDIIHIASHGLFSVENAIDSHSILLSTTPNHDGLLRADEIYNLDLSAAQIVVLSICNGSLYRFGPGDEPFGIIPALIAAGTANIIGTLWPLEDAVGRQMMVDFYRALCKTNPAQALRKAACYLIEADADVSQWASFTLCGAGRGWL